MRYSGFQNDWQGVWGSTPPFHRLFVMAILLNSSNNYCVSSCVLQFYVDPPRNPLAWMSMLII
jgi:hypothetical protein